MKLADLFEAHGTDYNGFHLYVQEPYGSGFDPKPVQKNQVLPNKDGDDVTFMDISPDGKSISIWEDGTERKVKPSYVDGIVLPKDEKVKGRKDFAQ